MARIQITDEPIETDFDDGLESVEEDVATAIENWSDMISPSADFDWAAEFDGGTFWVWIDDSMG